MPKSTPARAQKPASGQRPRPGPNARPTSPPSRPAPPQPTICHGVHGPCPKKTFDASAATAPTANPGTGPSAYPAKSAMSVVGFTFGIGANAIRPTVARAASAATSESTLADGRERSYHANPKPRTTTSTRNDATFQFTPTPAPSRSGAH